MYLEFDKINILKQGFLNSCGKNLGVEKVY